MSTDTANRWARTLRGAFVAEFKSQIRWYTMSGWLLSGLLSPAFLIATAYVTARFLAGDTVPPRFFELTGYPSYLQFVVLGLATHSLVTSALDDGGTAVYSEETQGTWDLIALTPMNRFVWMFGKTLAGMTASFLEFAIVLTVGAFIFDLTFTPTSASVALAGLVLTILGLQGFGFLMAAAGLKWKQPFALAMLLSPLIVFGSGMVFPVEALPPWVQTVAAGFPLTHGLHIIRDAVLLGAPFGALTTEFAWLAATGAAFMGIGFSAFRVMEKRALKAGALGKY